MATLSWRKPPGPLVAAKNGGDGLRVKVLDRDPSKMDTARREARMGREVYNARRSQKSSIGQTAGRKKGPEDRKERTYGW